MPTKINLSETPAKLNLLKRKAVGGALSSNNFKIEMRWFSLPYYLYCLRKTACFTFEVD